MLKHLLTAVFAVFFLTFFISCQKDIDSSAGLSGGTATFVLEGAPGGCLSATVDGVYATGTDLNASNTVTITVDVQAKGTYSFRTNSANGVYFAASGSFSSTGSQTVVLTGVGKPVSTGNFAYATTNKNSCNFNVAFTAGTGGGGGGGGTGGGGGGGTGGGGTGGSNPTSTYYFQFKAGSTFIAADTANVVSLIIPNGGFIALSVQSASTSFDTSYSIAVTTNGNPQINTNYNTNTIGIPLSLFGVLDINNPTAAIYQADVSTPGQNIVIRFETIDYTNKFVKGTFSGVAKTPTGTIAITEGKFRSMIP